MMMPAAAMEPLVSAMMTPVVSAVMPAASGCFGRGEHCRAEQMIMKLCIGPPISGVVAAVSE